RDLGDLAGEAVPVEVALTGACINFLMISNAFDSKKFPMSLIIIFKAYSSIRSGGSDLASISILLLPLTTTTTKTNRVICVTKYLFAGIPVKETSVKASISKEKEEYSI
ncbi:hypothetical protein ACJX0J_038700, partial [Zea mays]